MIWVVSTMKKVRKRIREHSTEESLNYVEGEQMDCKILFDVGLVCEAKRELIELGFTAEYL